MDKYGLTPPAGSPAGAPTRRRLIAGAALTGPAILTLGTTRAWAASSCGGALQRVRAAGIVDGEAQAQALEELGHDQTNVEEGINGSCLVSSTQ